MRQPLLALALAAALAATGCGQAQSPLAAGRVTATAQARELEARPQYPQPTFSENEADVLYDMATFEAMEQLIQRAEKSIKLDYYIFSGPTAKRLAELIVAKHKSGVKAQVIVDHQLGTLPELKSQSKAVLDILKAGGVPLATHSTTPLVESAKGATIDHNKYFVVDDREALVGSMNLAKKFYNYHDLMMHVRGPIALDLSRQFDFDWYHATHPKAPAPRALVHVEPASVQAPGPEGAGMVRLVGTGLGRKTGWEALKPLLANAKTSIHVQMHELGDGPALDALIAAHRRGVDVRIILDPGIIDEFVPIIHKGPRGIVNAVAVDQLLKAKVNVRHYRTDDRFTTAHMKLAVIDGQVLFAGSTNWTPGGFERVAETNLEIHGGRAPAQAEAQFAQDWVQRAVPAEPPSALALALCKLYNKR